MFNHGNSVHMDASRSSVAALNGKKERVKDAIIRGNATFRNATRQVLTAHKGGDLRKPRTEAIAQKLGDTMCARSNPAASIYEIIAWLKEDGLSHYDARVFAARISVGFVDSIYADHESPPIEVLAPKLVVEDAEASAAAMRALTTRNPADFARALDERTESANLAAILCRKLQSAAVR